MRRDNWLTIRDRLADDIAAGKFAPGARLPTEPELCIAFGAGRHSVRRAVASLAVEGKLRVEQGRGTFVEAMPQITYQIGRRTRFRQNLLEQGFSPKGEHISAEILPAASRVAQALDVAEGTPVHRLLRRGLADGVPISLGMSFHSVALFPDLAERRAKGTSITEIYRDHGIADYFRKRTTIFTRPAGARRSAASEPAPRPPGDGRHQNRRYGGGPCHRLFRSGLGRRSGAIQLRQPRRSRCRARRPGKEPR